MEFLLRIVFMDNKNLDLILKKEELDRFIDSMTNNRVYIDKIRKTGIGVPLYTVKYYNYFEYTEEMKKASEERIKQQEQQKKEEISK